MVYAVIFKNNMRHFETLPRETSYIALFESEKSACSIFYPSAYYGLQNTIIHILFSLVNFPYKRIENKK